MEEALWDLDTAEDLERAGRFNAAAFYPQRAAEKAVKAALYHHNQNPWGHGVRELMLQLSQILGVQVPEDLLEKARELDRHYIPSRYPNAHPGETTPHEAYDRATALRAINAARSVIGYVRGLVEGGVDSPREG